MLNMAILQPDNPLNRWVAGGLSGTLLHRARSCAPRDRWNRPFSAEVVERYERVIAAYPPSEPLQDYLRQLEIELASEECPESPGEAATEAEASDG
jgi:hypothetical protein